MVIVSGAGVGEGSLASAEEVDALVVDDEGPGDGEGDGDGDGAFDDGSGSCGTSSVGSVTTGAGGVSMVLRFLVLFVDLVDRTTRVVETTFGFFFVAGRSSEAFLFAPIAA